MKTLEIKGDWNVTKGKLVKNRVSLASDDLPYLKGEHHEWLGRIEKRLGESREAPARAK